MSSESLRSFQKQCESDSELREKVRTAPDIATFLEIAREAGFEITEADWVRSQAEKITELSDEQLDAAVGGTRTPADKSGIWGSLAHVSC